MMLHFKKQKGQRGAWVGWSPLLPGTWHKHKIQPQWSVAPSELGADWLLPQALHSAKWGRQDLEYV